MVQQGFWKGFVTALALCVAFIGGSVFAGGPNSAEPSQNHDYQMVQEQKRIANALEALNRDGLRIKDTVTIEPEYSAFPVEIK